jgi:hypothetical protein
LKSSRATAPDGSLIIHRGNPDPHPGVCNTFIHPQYGSSQQYRGEKDQLYNPCVSLAKLALGNRNFGFCSILYQGIYLRKYIWNTRLARYKWITSHPERDLADAENDKPWKQHIGDEIDEEEIGASIIFPIDTGNLTVHLVVLDLSVTGSSGDEHKTDENIRKSLSRDVLNRSLGQLEFYTSPDCPSRWSSFGPAPHIQPKVLSNAIINRVRGWIAECFMRH